MVPNGADHQQHVTEIGDIIRQARQLRGLSLLKITQQARISTPTWRKVESGEPGVRPRTYEAIGNALGIPGRLVTNAIDNPREIPALAKALGVPVEHVDLTHVSDQALLSELSRRLTTRHAALSQLLHEQTGWSQQHPDRPGRGSPHDQRQQHRLRQTAD